MSNVRKNKKISNNDKGEAPDAKPTGQRAKNNNDKGVHPHDKKARHWQLTLNEVGKWKALKDYLMGLKNLNYLIACQEKAPTTGHPHIHCYVQFTGPQRLSKKKTEGAHLEMCRGTPQENVAYIKKEGDPEKRGEIIEEWGELRLVGNPTIKDIENMDEGELKELPGLYYNIVQKEIQARAQDLSLSDFRKKVEVFYIWGPSGIGKTNRALDILQEHGAEKFNDIKFNGTFWMGVREGGENALYDDFRDSHMPPSEFINLVDYNVHNFNIKGGHIKNKYKLIIITSIQDPTELYRTYNEKNGGEPMKQWIRRMSIIHIAEPPEKKFEDIVEAPLEEKQIIKEIKAGEVNDIINEAPQRPQPVEDSLWNLEESYIREKQEKSKEEKEFINKKRASPDEDEDFSNYDLINLFN